MNRKVPARAEREMNVMIQSQRYRFDCGIDAHSTELSPKHARYRGIALVWTAVFLMLIILLIGLSLDTGRVALSYSQLHNAADAGALAGARLVKVNPDEARRMAQMVAAQNMADGIPVLLGLNTSNDPAGDIIIGQYGYDRDLGISVFVPYDPAAPTPVNALAVIAKRDPTHGGSLPLNFGSIANVDTVNLTAAWQGKSGPYAIAVGIGGTGSGLICIRDDYTGLELGGGGILTVNSTTSNVNDGAIQINSFDDKGLYSNGKPILNALYVNLSGDDSVMKGHDIGLDSLLQYRQPPIPDPLASLPAPIPGAPVAAATNRLTGQPIPIDPGQETLVQGTDDVFFPPGYYPGGWRIVGGQVTLGSGIYILGGNSSQGSEAGLYINGGNLDASALTTATVPGDPDTGGVMFYVTGDGVVYLGGEGNVIVDPMLEAQCAANNVLTAYEGISIFVDRASTNTSTIIGTSGLDLAGTLYFPQKIDHEPDYTGNGQQNYALEVRGTGDGFGNQVIADSIYIPGTADVTINYDGRNRAPVTKAFLVE